MLKCVCVCSRTGVSHQAHLACVMSATSWCFSLIHGPARPQLVFHFNHLTPHTSQNLSLLSPTYLPRLSLCLCLFPVEVTSHSSQSPSSSGCLPLPSKETLCLSLSLIPLCHVLDLLCIQSLSLCLIDLHLFPEMFHIQPLFLVQYVSSSVSIIHILHFLSLLSSPLFYHG